MKDNYEMKQFNKRFAVITALFLLVIWVLAWICCSVHFSKACLISLPAAVFAGCVYYCARQMLKDVYRDVDSISKLMLDVLDGKEDYDSEVYKQGVMGILYTNFYKMVTALRESQMKEGKEKEFLKDTISDISHQLKTPLASLNVFVDLLYDDKIAEEYKKKEVLAEAQKQLNRMEWMVLAMLKLARIEAGAVQFERKLCNVEGIIITAMESVKYLLEKRQQNIVTIWSQINETDKVKIFCDGEWLAEAIINLLKNASDYSKEQTTITIIIEENELFTRISVKDEGIGISQEALPHIFKRFYRVNHSVNAGSVGIGLSLTKSIVEGMQGKIIVKSEENKYTCFVMTFLK